MSREAQLTSGGTSCATWMVNQGASQHVFIIHCQAVGKSSSQRNMYSRSPCLYKSMGKGLESHSMQQIAKGFSGYFNVSLRAHLFY